MRDVDCERLGCIESGLHLAFGHSRGYWGCKNVDSVFLYANEEYGKIIGVKHHQDVVGRTDFDMPCDTVACASAFREQDKEVMLTQSVVRILDIHPFANGWSAYLTTKRPLYDHQGRVMGTIFHGEDITSPRMIELGTLLGRVHTGDVQVGSLSQGSYRVGELGDRHIRLTARESEVLFFLIRGQSAKKVAEILNMSMRTVEDHIGTLRRKFCATSKSSLIEGAIYLGYLRYIPKALLSRQLSVMLREG